MASVEVTCGLRGPIGAVLLRLQPCRFGRNVDSLRECPQRL